MEPYDPYPSVRTRRDLRRRTDRFDDDLELPPEFAGFVAPEDDESRRPEPETDAFEEPTWTTWLDAFHGPEPRPHWVVTALGAIDTDLGVLKTGKEADVHLVERAVPGGARSVMAAKRYRGSDHRLFHRDAGYLEGRRVRRSRENRAMARRTEFGREVIAGQWAGAEFAALARLWELWPDCGVRVPYPVQLRGTELMLEFIGDADGVAAPRLAQLRPTGPLLDDLWRQCLAALFGLAEQGLAHGDLSAYNVLVHEDDMILIDLPQIVDVVANPQGPSFLERDVRVMATWFGTRGVTVDAEALTRDLLKSAGLPPP